MSSFDAADRRKKDRSKNDQQSMGEGANPSQAAQDAVTNKYKKEYAAGEAKARARKAKMEALKKMAAVPEKETKKSLKKRYPPRGL